MKYETNGKSNWERLILAAAVAGTGIADADYRSCFAANDGCSKRLDWTFACNRGSKGRWRFWLYDELCLLWWTNRRTACCAKWMAYHLEKCTLFPWSTVV